MNSTIHGMDLMYNHPDLGQHSDLSESVVYWPWPIIHVVCDLIILCHSLKNNWTKKLKQNLEQRMD